MSFTNKLLDPKNDMAFKRIFGTEKNKDILIHFLNDMLVFKNTSPIKDVTFLKPVLDPEILYQKTSINAAVLAQQLDDANAKGLEKGLAEGKRQIILAMIDNNLDDGMIMECSGLTYSELLALKKTL